MEKWTSESRSGMQIAISILAIVAGLILVAGFHNFSGPGMTNSKAGFLLGVLILVIGIIGILFQGGQTVIVDPMARRIIIEDKTQFGRKIRSIGFNEIIDIGIGYLGKRSNLCQLLLSCSQTEKRQGIPAVRTGTFLCWII